MTEHRPDRLSDWTAPPTAPLAAGEDAPIRSFPSAEAALRFLSLLPPVQPAFAPLEDRAA